ncbi:MAG: flagellar basal body rod protein FlgB [Gammaproteobacteria bacterium]|nr:flagellar basal body rod protein FlgB [Gammaproteobacteria bacterium]
MGSSLDKALGIHDDALKLREQRASILAGNIANAETPNYKARDIDFQSVLQRMSSNSEQLQPTATSGMHLGGAGEFMSDRDLLFRRAVNPSLDGNTVDTQMEYLEFARNTAQYQASLKLLGDKFKGIRSAITGGQ